MTSSRKILTSSALAVVLSLGAVLQSAAVQAQPALTIQQEEAAHPRLTKAIHEMRDALAELEAAPSDFGGNKAAAVRDTKQAIHSLKKALYFRLKMDDAAIDKIQ